MHHKIFTTLSLVWLATLAGCNQHARPISNAADESELEQEAMVDDDFPPKPTWKPNVPIDIERTVKTFTYYTDGKSRFAVFENGTCVAVPADVVDVESHAKYVLDKIYNYHPDFNPLAMDDGNYMVTYSQSGAASIVFADEYENHRDYIDRNHKGGLVRDEVLLDANKQANVFDQRGKVGLFGRARMFLDAQSPKIVHVHLLNAK